MTDDLRETSKKVSKYRFRIPSNWVELGQVRFEKELSILPDNQPRSISKDLPYFLLWQIENYSSIDAKYS